MFFPLTLHHISSVGVLHVNEPFSPMTTRVGSAPFAKIIRDAKKSPSASIKLAPAMFGTRRQCADGHRYVGYTSAQTNRLAGDYATIKTDEKSWYAVLTIS